VIEREQTILFLFFCFFHLVGYSWLVSPVKATRKNQYKKDRRTQLRCKWQFPRAERNAGCADPLQKQGHIRRSATAKHKPNVAWMRPQALILLPSPLEKLFRKDTLYTTVKKDRNENREKLSKTRV